MKKYISLIIALVVVLTGIIGTIACLSPSKYQEAAVVNKYINAIDDAKPGKMVKYTALQNYADILGTNVEDAMSMSGADASKINVKSCLAMSGLNANARIPADAEAVKSVKLVCYKKVENGNGGFSVEDLLNMEPNVKIDAVIEVVYISVDGEKVSFMSNESFNLIKTSLFGYTISYVE